MNDSRYPNVPRTTIEPQTQFGWIKMDIDGYICDAKVFNLPSSYGLYNGCVSKLYITKNGKCVYNYDRGLDFNTFSSRSTVRQIVTILEETVNGKVQKIRKD